MRMQGKGTSKGMGNQGHALRRRETLTRSPEPLDQLGKIARGKSGLVRERPDHN